MLFFIIISVLCVAFWYVMSRNSKSVLFVIPDYHSSFFFRDELRHLGWKADIYVPYWYPKPTLYSEDVIHYGEKPASKLVLRIKNFLFLLKFFYSYQNYFLYSSPNIIPLHDDWMMSLFGRGFQLDMMLAKTLRKKIIFMPSGCNQTETQENVAKLDNGNVCGNCLWSDGRCNDVKNNRQFAILRRYVDVFTGGGQFKSTQYPQKYFRCKAIDLDLWHPDLDVPPEFKLPDNGGKVRILHGFNTVERGEIKKNIKGSSYILAAVKRLQAEGYPVEMLYLNDIPAKHMKYYQAQADIVVDQLIYGTWGSSAIEAAALGKPVVCYLRAEWMKNFFEVYPEYDPLPFVNADTATIYDVLKELVSNSHLRSKKGQEARLFVQDFYNVKKNVHEFIQCFDAIG